MRGMKRLIACAFASAIGMSGPAAHADGHSRHPFWVAIARGDVQAVEALLAACEDDNMPSSRDAKPLADWLEVCQAVGVEFPPIDWVSSSPLGYASSKGHPAVIATLLAHGANVNARVGLRSTPLGMAIRSGHPAAVAVLLEAGARVDAEDIAEDLDYFAQGVFENSDAVDAVVDEIMELLRRHEASEP